MEIDYDNAYPKVLIKGEGHCIARLYGILDVNNTWLLDTPVPEEVEEIDTYIKETPFYIGRQVEDAPEDCALILNSNRISRSHAIITQEHGNFFIKCLSKNGIDINNEHIGENEVRELPSKSAIRIGPAYLYFLLPKAVGGNISGFAISSSGGSIAGEKKKDDTVATKKISYKDTLLPLVDTYFAHTGYFNLMDVVKAAKEQHGTDGELAKTESLKKGYLTQIQKLEKDGLVEMLPPHRIPESVLKTLEPIMQKFGTKKVKEWWRLTRSDVVPPLPADTPNPDGTPAPAPAPAVAAGGSSSSKQTQKQQQVVQQVMPQQAMQIQQQMQQMTPEQIQQYIQYQQQLYQQQLFQQQQQQGLNGHSAQL